MGLDESTLKKLRTQIGALTADGTGVILDAATGAGETTAQLAAAMKEGKLITVDQDAESWEKWAKPLLKANGLLRQVEFHQDNLRYLTSVERGSCDLVVSHSTLSAMGVWAIDAIRQFRRVLKPGGTLLIADLLPENESEPQASNISALSWRLMKAAAHLAGQPHYEELPVEWVKARVQEAGFQIESVTINPERPPASPTSFEEWRRANCGSNIEDPSLCEAFRATWRLYVERAENEGLTNKEGSYTLWARA